MKYLRLGSTSNNGISPYDYNKSAGLILEQLKILRTKIDVISKQRKCKKIAVTSSIAGEGKTLLSTNLAIQLVRRDQRKVLLLDADIRKPSVSRYLEVEPAPGLYEYLDDAAGLSDILRISKKEGLYVILGGATDRTSTDMVMSSKFRTLLEQVEESFDYIIIDTPPVVPVADLVHIKTLVDGIIFVYRLGYTPLELFNKALEEVGRESILGVVLNCSEEIASKDDRHYYYGYRSGQSVQTDVSNDVLATEKN